MALVNKTVQVCDEVDKLLDLVVSVIVDAKAGKGPAAILLDLSPKLVVAFGGLAQVGPELADKKHVEMTIAVKVAEVAAQFTA